MHFSLCKLKSFTQERQILEDEHVLHGETQSLHILSKYLPYGHYEMHVPVSNLFYGFHE